MILRHYKFFLNYCSIVICRQCALSFRGRMKSVTITHRGHEVEAMKNITINSPAIGLTVDIIIEIPKGSFIKRRTSGKIDFLSPVPCPFNYGSVEAHAGPDGDFLDAAVLGPRLRRGSRVSAPVIGVIRMIDAGVADDKLICSNSAVGPLHRTLLVLFFRFYALCKGLINNCRGRSGKNRCLGWCDAAEFSSSGPAAESRVAPGIGKIYTAPHGTGLG
jgi:inorganic pyrophosphatase